MGIKVIMSKLDDIVVSFLDSRNTSLLIFFQFLKFSLHTEPSSLFFFIIFTTPCLNTLKLKKEIIFLTKVFFFLVDILPKRPPNFLFHQIINKLSGSLIPNQVSENKSIATNGDAIPPC